jgi:signal transduction histidine kinase
MGIYQNYPKVFTDRSGRPAGIFVDLITGIAGAEGWSLEFVPGTFGEGLDRLRRGEIDLMPDVAESAERRAYLNFNSEPVLSDWFQVFCRTGSVIKSITDLEGRKIIVLENSIQATAFRSLVQSSRIKLDLIVVGDYEEAIELLQAGSADALIANRYFSLRDLESAGIEETPIIFNPTELHFATRADGPRDLLDGIDLHLLDWKKTRDSIYYRALERWTGEPPKFFIPILIKYLAVAVMAVLLVAASFVILLRFQVKRRTKQLEHKTRELESAYRSLEEAHETAIKQERLHALGQMVSGIAHDFNNILMPVTGLSQIMLDQPDQLRDMAKVRRNLKLIANAGKDGSEIVRRMREFYRERIAEPVVTPVDPSKLLRRVIELTSPRWSTPTIGRGIRVEVRLLTEKTPPIMVPEVELREVLVNLIFNAVDAMPSGGEIVLSTAIKDDTVSIAVHDSGVGMTEEVMKKCLLPFFTTKGEKGTGMGLTMVKDLCERHGGRLDLNSEAGVGTTVTLLFPAASNEATIPREGKRSRIRPLRVLAVDDEPRSLEVVKTILESSGHTVTAVTDPRRVKNLVESERYDFVLVDRAMPFITGEQLALELAQIRPDLPVIMLTGTPIEEEQSRHMEGIRHVLIKPLDLLQLEEILAGLGL